LKKPDRKNISSPTQKSSLKFTEKNLGDFKLLIDWLTMEGVIAWCTNKNYILPCDCGNESLGSICQFKSTPIMIFIQLSQLILNIMYSWLDKKSEN